MAQKAFVMRIRSTKGNFSFDNLQPDVTTLAQLKEHIANKTGIATFCQKFKMGYPPAPVFINNNSSVNAMDLQVLAALGLRNGDTIIIEEDPNAVPPVATVSSCSISQQILDKIPKLVVNGSLPLNQAQDGSMVRRVVPSDNSCLFASISFW